MDGNNIRNIIILSIAIYIINSIKAFSLSVVSFLSHFLSSVRHPQLMHRSNPTTPPHPTPPKSIFFACKRITILLPSIIKFLRAQHPASHAKMCSDNIHYGHELNLHNSSEFCIRLGSAIHGSRADYKLIFQLLTNFHTRRRTLMYALAYLLSHLFGCHICDARCMHTSQKNRLNFFAFNNKEVKLDDYYQNSFLTIFLFFNVSW